MRLLVLFLVGLFLLTQVCILQAADVKWMLLGVVIEKGSVNPVKNIDVCLEVRSSQERICTTTLGDGYFQFSLEKDMEYWIHLIDKAENIIDTKEISTIGKEKPEIMHLMLEYPEVGIDK